MRYEEFDPIGKDEASRMLRSADLETVQAGLYRAALSLDDWRWIQDRCLEFVDHEDRWTVHAALTCLGHLGRLHGTLDADRVLAALDSVERKWPELAGRVQSLKGDISVFVSASNTG